MRHTVGKGYGRQLGTIGKSSISNACHATGDSHGNHTAANKSPESNTLHASGNGHGSDRFGFCESPVADVFYRIRDHDVPSRSGVFC
jgi:hypothetical protein